VIFKDFRMSEIVFLAGATGAVGTALIPLLKDAGFQVHGTTRRADRLGALEDAGVQPVLVDVFDAPALAQALDRIRPWGVIHQLTDLPATLDPVLMAQAVANNARLRDIGTRHLVAAAESSGVRRFVAQSIAWAYAPGVQPFTEDAPLDIDATGARATSVGGVVALETSVLGAKGMVSTVLRYGQLFGPGTSARGPAGTSPVHVEAAAWAALLALQRSAGGVFNITDDNPVVSNVKAKALLDFDPSRRVARGHA